MKRDFGDYLLTDNTPEEILSAVKEMFKLTNHKSLAKKKSEYKKITSEYKKYLKSNSLENLNLHMPIARCFLEKINSQK